MRKGGGKEGSRRREENCQTVIDRETGMEEMDTWKEDGYLELPGSLSLSLSLSLSRDEKEAGLARVEI